MRDETFAGAALTVARHDIDDTRRKTSLLEELAQLQ
jgi:hypothetical protein